MFLLTLLGLGRAFIIERHAPTLMLAQRTPAPTRIHPEGPTDPLFFEKFFKERGFPIVIRTTRITSPIESQEMGDKPVIFRVHGGPLDERSTDAPSESRRLFRPRPGRKVGNGESNKSEKKASGIPSEARGHSAIFYIFIIFLFVVVGLSGYQAGKAAESRNYVRLPSTN